MNSWRPFWLVLLILGGVGLFLRLPGSVAAHAFLLGTQPANGAVVAADTREVRLTFSERVTVSPDRLTVTDASGRRVDNRDARLARGDQTVVVATLGPLTNGVYTVRYAFLSEDTHTVRGSFQFGVGVSPVDLATGAAARSGATLDLPVVLDALARWLNLLGLALLVGVVMVRLLLARLPIPAEADALDTVVALHEERLLRWARIALGGLLLTQVLALFAVASASTTGGLATALSPRTLGATLATRFGALWLARVGALLLPAIVLDWLAGRRDEAAGARGAADTRRRSSSGWWVLLGLAGLLLLLTSLGGHAATTPPVALSVLIDWIHLAATALWIGGLFALTLLLPGTLRSLGSNEGNRLLAAIAPRFSTLAFWSVEVLVVTGLYQSWAHLPDPAALANSGYGRALLVKLALLVPLLALGGVNRYVWQPRLRRLVATATTAGEQSRVVARRFQRTLWGEALLSVVVLLAVGLLTALPPARQPVAAASTDTANAAPSGDLTLAGNAGPTLVTLTIGPTGTGPAVLTARLQDATGTALTAATVAVTLQGPDGAAPRETTLTEVRGRFIGSADLSKPGPWTIDARVTPTNGAPGTARFQLTLPAGGARYLLVAADAAMNRLTSLREHQTLSSGGATVTSDYEYVAPDRIHIQVDNGSETIGIGPRRFDRTRLTGWQSSPWVSESGGYRWPNFDYARRATEVTLLGQETVDGVNCWVVTFLDPETEARYTFWIGDRDSLIRRERMVAPGHYMESRLGDFNAPMTIEAPAP